MPGGDDPDNRRDFPGGFPADPQNAFTAASRTPEQQDVFTYVQSLLALRREHPPLTTGKQLHIGWDDSYYAFVREVPEEKLLVVFNNSFTSRQLTIPVADTPVECARSLDSLFGGASAAVAGTSIHATLPSKAVGVFAVH